MTGLLPGRAARRLVALLAAAAATSALLSGCSPTPPTPAPGSAAPSPAASTAVAGTPPDVPLLVSLSRSGSLPAVGYPTLVTASALGSSPIAAVELWDGPVLVETYRATSASPAATVRWSWRPSTAGDQILVARAVDADGREVMSNALRVRVQAVPAEAVSLVSVVAPGGETLAQVVSSHGGDPALAAARNSALPADGPLAAGTTVLVPTPLPAAPPPPADPAGDFVPAAAVATALPAPTVTAVVDGCTVHVKASGGGPGMAGLAVYDLAPGTAQFTRVATLALPPSGSTTYDLPVVSGDHLVTVAAFNDHAIVDGTMAAASVPSSCPAPGWTGTVALVDGDLIAPQPVDRAYVYVSDGGPWRRVPEAADAFVPAQNGVLDFSGVLPPLTGDRLLLEAWGWRGGSLVQLGSGVYQQPADKGYVIPKIGLGTSLDGVNKGLAPDDTQGETYYRQGGIPRPDPVNKTSIPRLFKWSTNAVGATRMMWQVLPYPLDSNPTVNPPGMLLSGFVDVPAGEQSGEFSIDMRQLFPGAIPTASASDSFAPVGLFGPNGGAGVPNAPVAKQGTPTPTPAVNGGDTLAAAALSGVMVLSNVWVRILPMAGSTPTGTPSNTVQFDVTDPPPQVQIPITQPSPLDGLYTLGGTFYNPLPSNPAYTGCLRILSVDWAAVHKEYSTTSSWEPIYQLYDTMAKSKVPQCPKQEDDSGFSLSKAFDAFVSVISSAWDGISEAFAYLKEQIVNAVLTIVPCDQFVGLAGVNDKDAHSACESAATAALDAVMVAYGIPPELPTSEQLVSVAKGDIVDYAEQLARDTVPGFDAACDAAIAAHAADSSVPTCDSLIAGAIDKVEAAVKSAKSQEAQAETGLSVPAHVLVEVEPRGLPQPPHANVTLTRTTKPMPADAKCTLHATMTDTLANWTWTVYDWSGGTSGGMPGTKQVSGKVQGDPFAQGSVNVPDPGPGKSVTIDLWLEHPNIWFEPGLAFNDDFPAKQYAKWGGGEGAGANHAWVLIQKGATAHGKVWSTCGGSGEATQTISQDAAW